VWTADAAEAATATVPVYARSTYLALADPGALVRLLRPTRLVPMTLVGVGDLPRALTLPLYAGAQRAFSLTYRGPAGVPQNTYRVIHEFGYVRLFLTPVGPPSGAGAAEQTYEAVIDRLYRPTALLPAPRPASS
jgi:hypothetical protein